MNIQNRTKNQLLLPITISAIITAVLIYFYGINDNDDWGYILMPIYMIPVIVSNFLGIEVSLRFQYGGEELGAVWSFKPSIWFYPVCFITYSLLLLGFSKLSSKFKNKKRAFFSLLLGLILLLGVSSFLLIALMSAG